MPLEFIGERCVYNRTKSSWFEVSTFKDWFSKLMLPRLKKQKGKK